MAPFAFDQLNPSHKPGSNSTARLGHLKLADDMHAIRLNQVTLPLLDYAESVAFYEHLGLRLIVDSPPHYARLEFPCLHNADEPATLSIHAVEPGWKACDGSLIYFEVENVDAFLAEKRVIPIAPPLTQRYLWREADIHDPAGNRLRIFQAGANRRFPPWRLQSS